RLEGRRLLVLCNVARGVTHGPNAGKVRIDPATDKRTRADHVMLTTAGRDIARQSAEGRPEDTPSPPPQVCTRCRSRDPEFSVNYGGQRGHYCDNCLRESMCTNPSFSVEVYRQLGRR